MPKKYSVRARRVDTRRQTVEAQDKQAAVSKAIDSPNFWHDESESWLYYVEEVT